MPYIGRNTDKLSNVEVLDNITFDGSQSYTLQKNSVNFTPSSANTILISIDGVVQAGNFTVSGSTIDFGVAIASSSTCDFILHYGVGLITTPADGTITDAKLAASAINSQTAETSIAGGDEVLIYDTSASALRKMTRTNFVSGVGGENTPAFLATKANTGFTGSVWSKIEFATEVLDTDNCYDNSTNYRFTPNEAGYYYVFGRVGFDNDSVADRQIAAIYKNGSNIAQKDESFSSNVLKNNNTSVAVDYIVQLNGSSDYIELYGYVTSNGSTQNVLGAGAFGAYKIIGA